MRTLAPENFLARRHAGAIHQPMKMAESVHRAGHRRLALLIIGHVGRDKARRRAQLSGHDLSRRDIDVGDDDLAALGDQLARHGGAKTGAAARDDKHFILDLHLGSSATLWISKGNRGARETAPDATIRNSPFDRRAPFPDCAG